MKNRPPCLSNRYVFLPRHSLAAGGLWTLLACLVLVGCGPSGTSQDGPAAESRPPGSSISLPLTARLKSVPTCDTDLVAHVIVDGDESNRIGLLVDCAAGTVSGTIPGLAPGSHTFEIRFTLLVELNAQFPVVEVVVATAVTTGDIRSGQDTPIAFAPGSLVFPDDDRDGWTNLAELVAGTDYLLASSAPESSARRRSARYSVADSLGATPAVGAASGGRYIVNSAGAAPVVGAASGGPYADSSGRVPSNR